MFFSKTHIGKAFSEKDLICFLKNIYENLNAPLDGMVENNPICLSFALILSKDFLADRLAHFGAQAVESYGFFPAIVSVSNHGLGGRVNHDDIINMQL